MKLKASFWFLMLTAAYLFLKRFYLHELIGLFWWLVGQAYAMSASICEMWHHWLTDLVGIDHDSTLICLDADVARKCWLALRRNVV